MEWHNARVTNSNSSVFGMVFNQNTYDGSVLAPRVDLESVAYIYAAVSNGGGKHKDKHRAPWLPEGSREDVNVGEWDTGRDSLLLKQAVVETGLQKLGPIAWKRWMWLKENPEALGDRGRAYLIKVKQGIAVYEL